MGYKYPDKVDSLTNIFYTFLNSLSLKSKEKYNFIDRGYVPLINFCDILANF